MAALAWRPGTISTSRQHPTQPRTVFFVLVIMSVLEMRAGRMTNNGARGPCMRHPVFRHVPRSARPVSATVLVVAKYVETMPRPNCT